MDIYQLRRELEAAEDAAIQNAGFTQLHDELETRTSELTRLMRKRNQLDIQIAEFKEALNTLREERKRRAVALIEEGVPKRKVLEAAGLAAGALAKGDQNE